MTRATTTRHLRGPWSVLATASALPGPSIATAPFLRHIDNRFDTTLSRTGNRLADRLGIAHRHFSRDWLEVGEPTRDADTNPELCARALRGALTAAAIQPNTLGYLLGHTTSPHTLLPANIAWVADHLNYAGPFAELRQACTGFGHALQMAIGLLATDDQPIAIVGSETGSVYMDPRRANVDLQQLVNLIQMGDGAGAIILARPPAAGAANPHAPKIATIDHAFVGSLGPGLTPGFSLPHAGSGRPALQGVSHFEHDPASVRSRGHALFAAAIAAAQASGVDLSTIDLFLPHQVNARELPHALAQQLNIPLNRIVIDCDQVGNLGSAAIWVALDRLRASNRLKPGQRVLILGAEATKYLHAGFVYTHA